MIEFIVIAAISCYIVWRVQRRFVTAYPMWFKYKQKENFTVMTLMCFIPIITIIIAVGHLAFVAMDIGEKSLPLLIGAATATAGITAMAIYSCSSLDKEARSEHPEDIEIMKRTDRWNDEDELEERLEEIRNRKELSRMGYGRYGSLRNKRS